jgi:hypothetical protein
MLKKRSGLLFLTLISHCAFACGRADTAVKDLDKAKLTWQWRSQGKGDQASEFRIKCGTASGRYELPVVRVPFPNLEVPIKQVAKKSGRYFCVVTAANESGESSPTNEISFNIGGDKTTSRPAEPSPPPVRRPAEPGSYEVIQTTSVYEEPSESSRKVSTIQRGTRVTVVGSAGEWLEVRSKHGNPPGFIRRDDAMFVGRRD